MLTWKKVIQARVNVDSFFLPKKDFLCKAVRFISLLMVSRKPFRATRGTLRFSSGSTEPLRNLKLITSRQS